MKKVLSLVVLSTLLISTLGLAVPVYAQTGPATDRIIWKQFTLEVIGAALEKGEVDVYLYGLRAVTAQELAGKPGIKLYQAPAGLVDLGLNPAPVMIVKLPGELSKAEAAQKLGVDQVVVAFAEAANGTTTVDLCVKLTNLPADAEVVWSSDEYELNPFCFRDIRFAMNYIVDREFIVSNIYKGFAIAKYALYGPDDPVFTELVDLVAKYKFTYNPQLANQIVSDVLTKAGAEFRGGKWYYNDKPVTIIGIIRIEDERFDIGNLFADELERLGITVMRQNLPFGEAITKVYATDPKDFEWFFYTEGWGKGALDKWDPWNLFFAAPWLGWMPGWGEPAWWNYRNETIDFYSRATGLMEGITSKEQWIDYLRKGTELSIRESVRIWIAAINNVYPASADLRGVTLDLGAGLRNPFLYRGMYIPGKDTLVVGHRWVFTARTVWNPLDGFDDVYSVDPMRATWDPWVWRHPFNGEPLPFRVTWTVETAGPTGTLEVPADAIWWDAENDRWVYASELGRTEATSKVVFDVSKFVGASWHHGQKITFADILAEWAINLDIAYDPEKSELEASVAGPSRETFDVIVAIRPLPDENKLEVYLNYWHFDPNYIADFAVVTPDVPFELLFAMDYLAFVKKTYALDEVRARRDQLPHINLVLPDHTADVVAALNEIDFNMYKSYITLPDGTVLIPEELGTPEDVWAARLAAVQEWVNNYGIVWISHGAFKLVRFDKDAQELELEAFRAPDYPFGPTDWVFGEPTPTTITGVVVPLVEPGAPASIVVTTSGIPPIHVKYVLRDPLTGQIITTGEATPTPTGHVIELPPEVTDTFEEYAAYELTVIAYSEEIALPAEATAVLQTTARVRARIEEVSKAVGEVARGLEDVASRLEETQKAFTAQITELETRMRELFGEQVAAAITPLTDAVKGLGTQLGELGKQLPQLAGALEDVGRGVDNVRAAVDDVSSKVDDLSSKVDQVGATAKSADEKAGKAVEVATTAASRANIAMILGIINLILLLVAILLLVRRS